MVFILCVVSFLFLAPSAWSQGSPENPSVFRVCADPNNLPFSNQKQEGFENKIAALLATELNRELVYIWWPQRRGFLRGTLNAGRCEVVMGVPAQFDAVLTTRPYYQSTYVFVYPQTAAYQLTSLDDAILRHLRIGVHLIGDDYANSPPAHALSARGIVENVVGYSVYGNYAEDSPPGKIVEAVATRAIDAAIVWGPIAGYFAHQHTPPLHVVPLPADAGSPTLPFSYEIAMGVGKGEQDLKAKLDRMLEHKAVEIRAILNDYRVPIVGEDVPQQSSAEIPVQVEQQAVQPPARKNAAPAETEESEVQIADEVVAAEPTALDKNPYTGDPEAIAEGKEYYKMLNCYGCHGMRGGGGMGPSITDAKWNVGNGADADIMQQLMKGRGKMPSFEDSIDPDQAWKIIAYVRSLYKGSPNTVTW